MISVCTVCIVWTRCRCQPEKRLGTLFLCAPLTRMLIPLHRKGLEAPLLHRPSSGRLMVGRPGFRMRDHVPASGKQRGRPLNFFRADDIETFYNRTHRHSYLSGVGPEAFEGVSKRT